MAMQMRGWRQASEQHAWQSANDWKEGGLEGAGHGVMPGMRGGLVKDEGVVDDGHGLFLFLVLRLLVLVFNENDDMCLCQSPCDGLGAGGGRREGVEGEGRAGEQTWRAVVMCVGVSAWLTQATSFRAKRCWS